MQCARLCVSVNVTMLTKTRCQSFAWRSPVSVYVLSVDWKDRVQSFSLSSLGCGICNCVAETAQMSVSASAKTVIQPTEVKYRPSIRGSILANHPCWKSRLLSFDNEAPVEWQPQQKNDVVLFARCHDFVLHADRATESVKEPLPHISQPSGSHGNTSPPLTTPPTLLSCAVPCHVQYEYL